MKKSLLTKRASSRQASGAKKLPLIIMALVICFALFFLLPVVARTLVSIMWYPFDTVRIWVAESGSSLPQYLRERSTLINELEDLKIKIATEQGTENTIKKLQVENDDLRAQAGAVPDARVLARVIGRPGNMPYDLIMLDRGTTHGVTLNAPVFLGKDQVIGFVSKVGQKTAIVTLITTASFISSAYVIGPNIYTEAEGMGGGVLRVRIPQGIMLRTGDLVLLPAIDSGVYGVVSHIETSATQPEQYGFVTTNIPIQSLYYVSIGKEGIVPNSFAEAEVLVQATKQSFLTVDLPPGVLVTPETSTSSPGVATTSSTASSSPLP